MPPSFSPVYFSFDSVELSVRSREELREVAEELTSRPDLSVTIEGHCDERGTTEYNMALGERRATVTRNYLSNLGVPSGRLKTISYGEERPAAAGHDEDAWQRNRRSELVADGGR